MSARAALQFAALRRRLLSSSSRNKVPCVGIEIHAQLASKSKLFSDALFKWNAPMSTTVASFDSALPGTLPRLNWECVRLAIKAALVLKCSQIAQTLLFDRKHYDYWDLPSGYQITQKRLPLATHGSVTLRSGSVAVPIRQIHIEQDSAKSFLLPSGGRLIDLNRAGVALIEIVSEPTIRSAQEAALYVRAVQELLQDSGVICGGLEEGIMRMDVNVNWLSSGGRALTPRAELKNINGLGVIADAVDCELARQERLLDEGAALRPAAIETRSYDPVKKETTLMRRKEASEEYRYLPEFDLRQESVPAELVKEIRAAIPPSRVDQMASWQASNPRLPTASLEKLWTRQGLPSIFALALEKQAAHALFHLNWLTGPFLGVLNRFSADQSLFGDPARLIDLIETVRVGSTDKQVAKKLIFAALRDGTELEFGSGSKAADVTIGSELDREIANLLSRHPDRAAFAQSLEGRKRPNRLDFFVGPLMKTFRGRLPTPAILERLSQALDPE